MAMVLSAFVNQFARVLVDYAEKEVVMLLGVSKEIKKLITRLNTIKAFLEDAESKQLQDAVIRFWLDQLKDIMYQAEDIIDEYRIEAERYGGTTSCTAPLRKVWFGHNIGKGMKNINLRLDNINKDMAALNLVRSSGENNNIKSGISRRTSMLVEPDIVGSVIQNDTRSLVELLIKEHGPKNIIVYGIVGMGGIGKTTLAQKICSESSLTTHFNPIKPIWICVSQDIDEIKILQSIIKGVQGHGTDAQDKEELEPLLEEVVRQKKFFLVLDDVWDARVWEDLLRRPLHSAGAGSRILVTTRDERVAKRMGANYLHKIAPLSNDDCWSLLCKIVFEEGHERNADELKELGMQIIEKCQGLPLAVRTIAGLLRDVEFRTSEWEKILHNPSWSVTDLPEGVMQALYLSYQSLPQHLKQCFLYLAFLPEDFEIQRDYLVALWIAESFIEGPEDKLEELGRDYWKKLIERNLLRIKWETTCTMHDLLRSLALHLSRGEFWCGHARGCRDLLSGSVSLPRQRKPCRLYITSKEEDKYIPDIGKNHIYLRTLIDRYISHISEVELKCLNHLRVLHLGISTVERLPNSLGNLKLLRYLNVGPSDLRELPGSIGSLRNLQFLILSGCIKLRSLPESIGLLTNLLHLDVSSTGLESMPSGIRSLEKLQVLDWFVVPWSNYVERKKCSESGLCSLKDLNSLQRLRINKLERVLDGPEARRASLLHKSRLVHLTLLYGEESLRDVEVSQTNTFEEAMEELVPPRCLEELDIRAFHGCRLPNWLVGLPTALPNLRVLWLYDCELIEKIPTLGHLSHLEQLWILGARAVVRVGPELLLPLRQGEECRETGCCFPRLEILSFANMFAWEEWRWMNDDEGARGQLLPLLKELRINSCPKLRRLPHTLLNHAMVLTELTIDYAEELEEITNLYSIKTLYLNFCPNLKRIMGLSSLECLFAFFCSQLTEVNGLPELKNMELALTPGVYILPEWLRTAARRFAKLQKLLVRSKVSLLWRLAEKDSSDWASMQDIPCVNFIGHEQSNVISYTKYPFSFNVNIDSHVRELEEKAKSWKEQVTVSSLHEHPLLLLRDWDYTCCKCGESGRYMSFKCEDCTLFYVHPNCMLQEQSNENLQLVL